MTMRTIAVVVLLFVLGMTACGDLGTTQVTPMPPAAATPISAPVPTPTPTPEPTPTPDPIRERVEAMTDGELAGQLLVAGFEGTAPNGEAKAAIEELGVSGLILFSRNMESSDQLTALTAALNSMNDQAGRPPLFLCVDEEGGQVSRLTKLEGSLPAPYDYIQQGGDPAQLGALLSQRCRKYGLNVDFAPVLDVWSNPNNTVIGKRAYGSDAAAATLAVSTAQAMAEQGVIPVGKHFPGHGDTLVDSHVSLPVVEKTVAELEDLELLPFRAAIARGVPALMVAHILMAKIDPHLPASLSPAVVEGLLRADLGFDGVIFTDDLTMGAITQDYGLGEAAVLAVNAGCDQLLVCHGSDNVKVAYDALLSALADGSLSRDRARESIYRVLTLKSQFLQEGRN